jgi:replication initiation factor
MKVNQKALVMLVSPSVDWITATAKRNVSRETIAERAHAHLNDSLALGEGVQMWSSFGYDGWQTKGIRWGRRRQDDLIQASSETANMWWPFIVANASNVSRIDLAVTVKFVDHQIALVSENWQAIQNIAGDLPIIRNYTIISSLFGGDTLYVGSRSSQQFGRLYDKGLESKEPAFQNCHRWEVEFKKPLAHLVASETASADHRDEYILGRVKGWFEERLIDCPWESSSRIGAIQILRKRTTDEKALDWLSRAVSPTVARLIERGKAKDVLIALGIPVIDNEQKES